MQRLQESRRTAYAALYDSPESALSLTRTAAKRLDELCRIDPSLDGLREHLKTADLSLQEASYGLRDYLSRLEANPARLEEVETRLAAIDKLKRKYGPSIAEILAFLEEVRRRSPQWSTPASAWKSCARSPDAPGRRIRKAGRRTDRAPRAPRPASCEKRVEAELAQLAMERTVFRVEIAPAAWAEHGADRVDFLVSPNLGEEPRPLEKVASGGEISRIALALKTCLAVARAAAHRAPWSSTKWMPAWAAAPPKASGAG